MALLTQAQWAQVKGAFTWCKVSGCSTEEYEKISKYLEANTSGWCYLETHSREFLIAFEFESEMVLFKIWTHGINEEA